MKKIISRTSLGSYKLIKNKFFITIAAITFISLILVPQLSYARCSLLNPLDCINPAKWIENFFADLFFAVAGGIYRIGFFFVNWGVKETGVLIDQSFENDQTMAVFATSQSLAFGIMSVALLISIFATTLKINIKQWQASTMIPTMVLAGFLIIFSKPIAGVVYDLGNVMYKEISTAATSGFGDFANLGAGTSELKDIFSKETPFTPPRPGQPTCSTTASPSERTSFGGMLAIFVALIAFVAMIALCFILILRAIMIIVLVMFAPFAFASIVLPWTKKFHSQWWKQYTTWVFYLPLATFILFIGAQISLLARSLCYTGEPALSNIIPIHTFLMAITAAIVTIAAIFIPFKTLGAVAGAALTYTGARGVMKNVEGYGKGRLSDFTNKRKDSLYARHIAPGEAEGAGFFARAKAQGLTALTGRDVETAEKRSSGAKHFADSTSLNEYGNKVMAGFADELTKETDPQKRKEILKQAQAEFVDPANHDGFPLLGARDDQGVKYASREAQAADLESKMAKEEVALRAAEATLAKNPEDEEAKKISGESSQKVLAYKETLAKVNGPEWDTEVAKNNRNYALTGANIRRWGMDNIVTGAGETYAKDKAVVDAKTLGNELKSAMDNDALIAAVGGYFVGAGSKKADQWVSTDFKELIEAVKNISAVNPNLGASYGQKLESMITRNEKYLQQSGAMKPAQREALWGSEGFMTQRAEVRAYDNTYSEATAENQRRSAEASRVAAAEAQARKDEILRK
jgi:hypothetical protein